MTKKDQRADESLNSIRTQSIETDYDEIMS